MITDLNLSLSPKEASSSKYYIVDVAQKLGVDINEITHITERRCSIDARQRNIKINLSVRVYIGEEPIDENVIRNYPDVSKAPDILVVGSGPAGLFAALRLIENGFRPIILERGKDVRERKKDVAQIYRQHLVNPNSNYGFGEGGAGTYSDGKLYTRSKKRGNSRKILEVLVQFGANQNILIDAHPHVGTDKLPRVIENIRKQIISSGGEVHFNTRVEDLLLKNKQCYGVKLANGDKLEAKAVILATGHSARDVYEMLRHNDIKLETKSFAMGVRIEHPQALIDSMQYKCKNRGEYLPAATYAFAEQVNERGVYSFCMCPGGFIVPASTAPGEMVVNGMSPSLRNSAFANSGLVVEIKPEDLSKYAKHGDFAGVEFQKETERLCFKLNDGTQNAPAQRISDFVQGKKSKNFPDTSYRPGLVSSALHDELPQNVASRLRIGIKQIDRKSKGFNTQEGIVAAVESRTSSPLRIPRDKETLQHIQISGLYPCGEGAGYAGGIVSSAVDGERCADAISNIF
ncbi:MAG: NAD(P)/FAD-dependent oxidoreductase [Mangrovibacterium sp.]